MGDVKGEIIAVIRVRVSPPRKKKKNKRKETKKT